MKYIKRYKLFENHYDGTHWADNFNGKDVDITIQDVEEYIKNEPIIEIPVAEIKQKLPQFLACSVILLFLWFQEFKNWSD